MKNNIWFGLLAVLVFSTGCEDYLRWLYGDYDEPEPEPVCHVYRDPCTGERVRVCDDGDAAVAPMPERRSDCGWGGSPNHDCLCDDVYDPVCDAHGRQYSNRCEARCAGADWVRPCDGGEPPPGGGGCGCPRVWEPVCADGTQYPNRCVARCLGAHDVGPCNDCVCPDVWDPVCDAAGNRYGNRCEARCAGAHDVAPCGDVPPAGGSGGSGGDDPSDGRPGSCNCPFIWDPVCDADGNRYPNRCAARCQGATDVGDCRPNR